MSNNIDNIKEELKKLCSDYVNALEKLKTEGIITKDTFEICSSSKNLFLEE